MRDPLRKRDIEHPGEPHAHRRDQTLGADLEITDLAAERCVLARDSAVRAVRDAELRACDLSNGRLVDLVAARVGVSDSKLIGLDVSGGSVRDAQIAGSVCRDLRCFATTFTRVWFERCDLRGADFDAARLHRVVFRDCDLREARFPACDLGEVDLRGSRVEGLVVDPARIRGAVIAPEQADVFAAAIGLRVHPYDAGHDD
ncbi:MAG: pentapeptide repeat-containing protein [Planctomycetota bacterium]